MRSRWLIFRADWSTFDQNLTPTTWSALDHLRTESLTVCWQVDVAKISSKMPYFCIYFWSITKSYSKCYQILNFKFIRIVCVFLRDFCKIIETNWNRLFHSDYWAMFEIFNDLFECFFGIIYWFWLQNSQDSGFPKITNWELPSTFFVKFCLLLALFVTFRFKTVKNYESFKQSKYK